MPEQNNEPTVNLETHQSTVRKIRDYRLLQELGQGGIGTVYKAQHERLGTLVAIKILNDAISSDTEAIARFDREMKAIGKLRHENIVRALDAGEDNGIHYLVMEYLEGINLAELCDRCGPLPVAEACELTRRAAIGLQAAHELGLVHRDIKPANIMLTADGSVKILDLGLVRFQRLGNADTQLTAPQQVMGTVDYMAPEQALQSDIVDIRADIYSLGCSLYKFLSGDAPFDKSNYDTPMKRITAHARDPVPPIRNLRADLPDALESFLETMLAKSPDERPETPYDVVTALAPMTDGADLVALYRDWSNADPTAKDEDGSHDRPSSPMTETDRCVGTTPTRQATGHRILPLSALLLIAVVGITAVVFGPWFGKGNSTKSDNISISSNRDIAPIQQSADDLNIPSGTKTVGDRTSESRLAKAKAPLSISDFHVSVHRGEYADLVGNLADSVFDARFNDDVRISATLSEPCHCYLLALNPDGSEQLCYPADADTPPEKTASLEFPERTITFFGLTDGIGLQGFVLLASRQPLPAFAQWRRSVREATWTATAAEGVWKYNGTDINRLFNERGTIRERGAIRERVPRPFADVCKAFSDAPQIEAVQAIAFPVVQSE